MADDKKRSALVRVVAATKNLTAKTTYYAASLGSLAVMAAGVDPNTLPPALSAFAGGIGINVLSGMVERLARGEDVKDDDITDAVQYAIKETKIADALTESEFRTQFTEFTGGYTLELIKETMEAGFLDISQRLIEQTQAVQIMELRLNAKLTVEFDALHQRLDRMEADRQQSQPTTPRTKRELTVFISSPGDVQAERSIAADVVRDLSYEPEFEGWFFLKPLRWDDPSNKVPLPANKKAQESVDLYLKKPSDCEIVVVVFWAKMGSRVTIKGQQYESGTHYEMMDALDHDVTTFLFRCTADAQLSMTDPDFDEKRSQFLRLNQFFENLNPDGQFNIPFEHYTTPEHFREELTKTLKGHLRLLKKHPEMLQKVRKAADTDDDGALEIWTDSPFPGLRAFTEKDAPIFFGRSQETNELADKVLADRFTAVIGASGSGKSSLVGAGLLPRLTDTAISGAESFNVVRFKPGESRDANGIINPFAALYDGFAEAFPFVSQDASNREQSITEFAADPGAAGRKCREESPDDETLLFIDQFEETFTLVPESLRLPFVNMLVNLAVTDGIRTVVTMRSDFQPRCLEYPQLSALLNAGAFHLSAPRLGALHEMIVKPAERAALDMDDGLAAQILEDTGTSPGALALMAYALHELYEIAVKQRGDRQLTFQDYDHLGRVQGAIGKRADRIFEGLPGEEGAKTALLYKAFQSLVTVDDDGTPTRQRAPKTLFADDDAMWQLLDAFVRARLLVTDGYDDATTIEVAHEALFRSWGRLKDWLVTVSDDLRLLRQMKTAALAWHENDRAPAFVWRDQRNKDMLAMMERLNPPDLEDYERDFARAEVWHLVDETKDINVSHQRRQEIGVKLAVLGDPRKGVGLRDDGLPDIDWVYIDVPEDLRGKKIPFKDHEGKVYGEFALQPFYMARFPVTYLQFKPFADNPDAFNQDAWWQGMPSKYQKQAIDDQNNPYDNHPRDTVNWYDAVAYSRWLNSVLPNPKGAGSNWQIRLPTEWEWQWAATGGQLERVYPWGDEWDGRLANTSEAKIAKTTAVGMYAPYNGLFDMVGNILDWCLNQHNMLEKFAVDDSNKGRVRRGGSFVSLTYNSRCAFRYLSFSFPRSRSDSYGVRLVCAPIL